MDWHLEHGKVEGIETWLPSLCRRTDTFFLRHGIHKILDGPLLLNAIQRLAGYPVQEDAREELPAELFVPHNMERLLQDVEAEGERELRAKL